MKKIIRIFIGASLLMTFSCKKEAESLEEKAAMSLQENAKVPRTKIEFDKEIHDFGQIDQGEIVETTVNIKNIGDNNLYIVDAHGSCGCTVPEVTKEAIKPGESAPINVKFDSNGKTGEVTKTVMITCNTEKAVESFKIKASIKTK
ncbi:DUF1573 domain-containing protein [Flavobacterium terrigena]|uniref:DUF1573 domain-containing protein n=1 Tax=Flavobacterium terrigena TaxID=402734 RepID=A0A1H6YFA5_9FLAO|nr:DUF1573 domain-containing protein [Flavobacterium terrigena]SEJ38574.1 Protein of unknown function [Flavobacterium terrigena]